MFLYHCTPPTILVVLFSTFLIRVIGSPPSLIDFVQSPQPPVRPQTNEQDEYNMKNGRSPSGVELLQPTLDSTLPTYVKTTTTLSGNYTFAASDVLAHLSKFWVEAFMRLYPNVKIQIPPPYAGSLGAIELINDTLQGVFISRELKPSDLVDFQAAFSYPPTAIPITGGSYRQFGFLDAMAFIVNKRNPIESLSLDQLDAILSTTRARGLPPIRRWGDLGATDPHLADKDINIYGIKPWNGFEEFIRQHVLSYNGVRGEWRSGLTNESAAASLPSARKDPVVTWSKTVFNISQQVSTDPQGLGYTGLAYVTHPVKIIGIANHTGEEVITATYENIARARWPLTRVTYFVTNRKPGGPKDLVLEELTKFMLSEQGQGLVAKQGVFLPFRKDMVKRSLDMLGG